MKLRAFVVAVAMMLMLLVNVTTADARETSICAKYENMPLYHAVPPIFVEAKVLGLCNWDESAGTIHTLVNGTEVELQADPSGRFDSLIMLQGELSFPLVIKGVLSGLTPTSGQEWQETLWYLPQGNTKDFGYAKITAVSEDIFVSQGHYTQSFSHFATTARDMRHQLYVTGNPSSYTLEYDENLFELYILPWDRGTQPEFMTGYQVGVTASTFSYCPFMNPPYYQGTMASLFFGTNRGIGVCSDASVLTEVVVDGNAHQIAPSNDPAWFNLEVGDLAGIPVSNWYGINGYQITYPVVANIYLLGWSYFMGPELFFDGQVLIMGTTQGVAVTKYEGNILSDDPAVVGEYSVYSAGPYQVVPQHALQLWSTRPGHTGWWKVEDGDTFQKATTFIVIKNQVFLPFLAFN